MYENKIICNDWITELRKLPDKVFHCCVTSPPYWGQRLYSWGSDGSCYDPETKKEIHDWQADHILQICKKCGAKAPVFGLEKTPEEHIEKLVEGFREVRRVLRDDGVLFLNYSDKYSNEGKAGGYSGKLNQGAAAGGYNRRRVQHGVAQGNILMLPARVALALQADGWILRDSIIWAKAISFCPKHSGSTMPESVNGWRWERHRIKVKNSERGNENQPTNAYNTPQGDHINGQINGSAQWQDCPGCPKCEPNMMPCKVCGGMGKVTTSEREDVIEAALKCRKAKPGEKLVIEWQRKGESIYIFPCSACDGRGYHGYILRRGSWRCTKAHEHIFQFVKTNDYFCDMEAVREPAGNNTHPHGTKLSPPIESAGIGHIGWSRGTKEILQNRNLRNVWAINPRGYKEAHYATYPEAIIEPIIKVSTSQKGVCPKCGSQWARIIDKAIPPENRFCKARQSDDGNVKMSPLHRSGKASGQKMQNWLNENPPTTLGFKATCDCGIEETVPALVLDPFIGSGTTAVVATKLGRNYFGIDINPNYIRDHAEIRVRAAETGMSTEEVLAGQGGLFE